MSKTTGILLLALFASCSGKSDARLDPLAHATLDAGRGLGDVRLGETTLGAFVDRFGSGRTDLVVSDETGFELVFEPAHLAFLFLFESGRISDEEVGAMRKATRDLEGYLTAYPQRRELRLVSVSVAAGKSREDSFFKGRLDSGAALFDPLLEAGATVGIPADGPLGMTAGMSPDLPDDRLCYPDRGVVMYGQNLAKDDGPKLVTRMTIFEVR